MSTPFPVAPLAGSNIGFLPFSINTLPAGGFEYRLDFPSVAGFPAGTFAIRVDDYSFLSTGGDRDFGVSVCITGHGSLFSGRCVIYFQVLTTT